jgi:hypothetical protein
VAFNPVSKHYSVREAKPRGGYRYKVQGYEALPIDFQERLCYIAFIFFMILFVYAGKAQII